MKSSNIILILFLVFGLVVGVLVLSNANKPRDTAVEVVPSGDTADRIAEPDGTTNGPTQNDAYAPNAGVYQDYDPALLANADMGDVVLFFKAGWCPTCSALDRDIQAKLDQIPEDVTVLKVDYDSNQTLKQKYNVRVQHTLVQVDASGNEIKQWQGSLKLEQLLSEII